MQPTDLRRLKALAKDERMSSKEYGRMSRDFAMAGMMTESRMCAAMSKDELKHEGYIRKIITNVKKLK